MADRLAPIDVEAFLCDHLDVDVLVATSPPDPIPDDGWVRVVRTGGPRATPVSDRPTVTVEAFGPTETAAWRLMGRCRAWLEDAAGSVVEGVNVKDVVEIGGPGNLPHPTIPGARYTATYQLHLRGVIQS